jgi:site-specific DNA recombinase
MALTNLTMSEIARRLNRHGIPFLDGKQWTSAAVGRTLRNPKYAGINAWNRMTCKLHSRPKNLPREQWVVTPDAFPPVIDQDTFERVQIALKKRLATKTDERTPGCTKALASSQRGVERENHRKCPKRS